MLRLVSITFKAAPRLPGLRPTALDTIECDNPRDPLKHWRVVIRGASVFFISPPGWKPGRPWHEWDPSGHTTMHEVPRAECYFHWSGAPQESKDPKTGVVTLLDTTMANIDTVSKGRFDSPPFGGPVPPRPPAPEPEPEIDPKDIGDD